MFNVLAFLPVLVPFILEFAFTILISYAIAEYLRSREKDPEDALPAKFEAPTINEGETYPVVFGTPKRIESPVVAWWGKTDARPISEGVIEDFFPTAAGKTIRRIGGIAGYDYYMAVHFILCHGPVDGLKQIYVGEKRLWPVNTTFADDDITSISLSDSYQRDFYGGSTRGGGFKGNLDVLYGEVDQARNAYMQARLGAEVSAYRGLVSVILKKIRIGHSPFPGKWSFTVKRTQILDDGSPQWYIAKADINNDLNPIHILRECYTNTRWGLGYSEALFPAAIWEAAADAMYDDDFGLSRLWQRDRESLEDFIVDILRHIDGLIYQDPQTGNLIVKLIRNDYNANNLEEFDSSDVIEMSDLATPSLGEVPNVYQLLYSNILINKTASIPDQDIALINQQGGKLIPVKFTYAGITKSSVAGKVLARDRSQVTSMGLSASLKCKRTMSSLLPGDVFKLTMSSHSISQKIMRVLPNAKYGTLEDNTIHLKVVEDIFAIQEGLFAESPDSDWEESFTDPVPTISLVIEAPFWSLLKVFGKSLALLLDENAGYLMGGALQPSDDSLNYDLLVRNDLTLNFLEKGSVNFTAAPLTEEEMPLNAEDMLLSLDADLEGIAAGSFAIIDAEIVKVLIDIDSAGTQLVAIARGCLDTVPALHITGSRMWFIGTIAFIGNDELTEGDQPGIKVLPLTGLSRLDESDAPINNADAFNNRQDRPYPPGNVLINGESYPDWFASDDVESGETAGITISWSHRDRTQQTNYIVEHSEGNIGPEEGVAYDLYIYDEDGVLCHTELGLTGTSFFYSEAQEISDCGELQVQLRIELDSVRT